jgi:hypothetical protein
VEEENPALYQEYLANLREYKKTYHPVLIGWFDNSDKMLGGRAGHIASLPDKVDIVSLLYGDNLAEVEREEMAAIREDKGTRVVYTIDYEAFLADIVAQNEEIDVLNEEGAIAGGEAYVPVPRIDPAERLPGFMDSQLALLDKYGYDGFTITYVGKPAAFLTEEQYAELQATQDAIFNKVSALIQRNPSKTFLFEGRPDYVLNKELLADFDYIVFRTQEITDMRELNQTVKQSLIPGVPTDNIIVRASPSSLDASDTKTGYIADGQGNTLTAITALAYWVTEPEAFTKAGLGVYRINDDYFNAELDYKYVREAIDIMNPSPKN